MNTSDIKKKIKQFFYRKAKSFFPIKTTSYPYITGDSFRSIAHHICDEFAVLNPEIVQHGQIVFVSSSYFDFFYRTVLSEIQNNFVLILHGDDKNFNKKDYQEKFNHPKFIHVFGRNILWKDDQVTPIPIGIKSISTESISSNTSLFKKNKIYDTEKLSEIAYSFALGTGAVRNNLWKYIQNKKQYINITKSNTVHYLEEVSKYKKILSPQGIGFDCERTWESLYLNTLPVVEKNELTSFFVKIGVPLIEISDFKNLDEEIINFQNVEQSIDWNLLHNTDPSPLYMPFWIKLINSCK